MSDFAKIKMLLVIAAPVAKNSEPEFIEQLLTHAPLLDRYELHTVYSYNLADALAAADATKPEIIHFYGKCTAKGEFFFQKGKNQVSDRCEKCKLLQQLVAVVGELKLVYFNGVISDQDLALADDKIDFLVGMNSEEDDLCSLYFSRAFYLAVGLGNPVGVSFAKLWHGLPLEHRDLTLRFKKGIDPDRYFLSSQKALLH